MAMTDQHPHTQLETESLSSQPTIELVGQTRQQEARIAVGTAVGLIEKGVSPSDITITAVDVDPYEEFLERAAKRYGVTLAVWTPLNLKRTCPYQFAASLLAVLRARSNGAIDIETLGEPLRLGWVSPANGSIGDPLSPVRVDTLIDQYRGTALTIPEWNEHIAATELDGRTKRHLIGYLNWVDAQPQQPDSESFLDTVLPAMEAYDESVLPSQVGEESVSEVAKTVRGYVRTMTLLRTVHQRYSKWLEHGRAEREWAGLSELLDVFATTIPGRRELPTAAAVDVKAATDMWALNVPYVIAVGLVDTEWPRAVESPIPPASRAALAQSDQPQASGVRPHSSWTTARDHDHFVSAVDAAQELLVITRFTADPEGVDRRPSRFLDDIELTHSTDDVASLVGDPYPPTLPEAIGRHVSTEAHNE